MTAYERVLERFRAEGLNVIERGDLARAQAPGHGPTDLSVSIRRESDRVLVHSHSDPTGDVLDALGLTPGDLFDERRGKGAFPTPALTDAQRAARDERARHRVRMESAHLAELERDLQRAEEVARTPQSDVVVPVDTGSREVSYDAARDALSSVILRAQRHGTIPMLGTPAWVALPQGDPKRIGAIYLAALMWSMHLENRQRGIDDAAQFLAANLRHPVGDAA